MLKFLPHWIFRYKLHHIPFWVIYHYTWWVVSFGNPVTAAATILHTPQIITFTCYLVFHAAAVYFNLYFLVPRYLQKSMYATYLVLLLLSIISTSLLMVAFYYLSATVFGISLKELYVNGADCFFFFFSQAFPSVVASVAIVMCIKLIQGIKNPTLPEKESQDATDHIYIKSGSRHEKIFFDDILYVEGMQNYVSIHTFTQRHVALMSLKSLEEKLKEYGFLRIHKSYIISFNKITSFNSNEVSIGSKRLPVGRSYRKAVQQNMLAAQVLMV